MSSVESRHALQRLTAMSSELRAIAKEIETLIAALRASEVPAPAAGEFLKLDVLCDRIGYAPQTMRNLISQGELKVGTHFVQRRRHGKILFIWQAMEQWLRDRELDRSVIEPFIPVHHAHTRKIR